MSVVALWVEPEHYVMMASDGVATNPETGAVVSYVSKLTLLPEINTILGITGSCNLGSLLTWYMPDTVVDFDSLIEVLPELVEYVCRMAELTPGFMLHKSCVVAAGWSASRQKYEAWRVVTYPKESLTNGGEKLTLEPFKAHPVVSSGMWSSAGPGEEILKRFGISPLAEGETSAQSLVRMVCAARADSGIGTQEGLPFNAGGFIQLAMLQDGYVQSSIPHRWPEDVIGEPIDPTRGEALPQQVMERLGAPA